VSPAVQLDSVSVSYGPTRAISEVSLEVTEGEVVAVIGPSGCGKSSLLRVIGGLEPLAGGVVSLNGRNVEAVPTHQRDIGLMFQEHALFPHLDVAHNVAFGLRMAGVSESATRERVAELLELVELAGLAQRRIDELSGGEGQRVALARALAPSPAVLMLDEPFGSLDRVLREQLVADVGSLLRSIGQTAIHVTHDQPEAFAIADRVVVLNRGRIAQVGDPESLWRNPNDSFVARFLGHPNLWLSSQGGYDLIPVSSLTVDAQGSVNADVTTSRFTEGVWRHNAVASRGDLEFDHKSRLTGTVALHVDVARTRHLPS
jgi:thiamine transport system ATP-binding protein